MDMYKLGESQKHRRRRWLFALTVLLLLVIGGTVVGAQHFLKSFTTLTQAQPITQPAVLPNAEKYQQVNGSTFSMEVATTWKQVTLPANTYKLYRWQGTKADDSQRWTDVYVDTVPDSFPLNHMLPIQAVDNKLTVLNTVSDNCADFTDASKITPKPATAPAKWSGIAFVCDLANYARDVVGTATSETGSAVVLKGPSGTHRYFFVYTDNGPTPDYTVFSRQLESFRSL